MKVVKVPSGESFRSKLRQLNACQQARRWVGRKSLRTAWNTCRRPEWMIWLASIAEIDSKILVLTTCECGESLLPMLPSDAINIRIALEKSKKFAIGKASKADVKKAISSAIFYTASLTSEQIVQPKNQAVQAMITSAATAEAPRAIMGYSSVCAVSFVRQVLDQFNSRKASDAILTKIIKKNIPVKKIENLLDVGPYLPYG